MSTALPQLPEAPVAGTPHAIAPSAAPPRAVRTAKARDSPPPANREARPALARAWCVPTDPPPI